MTYILFCIVLSLFFKALIWCRLRLDSVVVILYLVMTLRISCSVQVNPRTKHTAHESGELLNVKST